MHLTRGQIAAVAASFALVAAFLGARAYVFGDMWHVYRSDAAREVALATELECGHDATAEALDAGLVSPRHAAVIVQATGQTPRALRRESFEPIDKRARPGVVA